MEVAHIGLVVKDVDVSSLFYRLVLGCEPNGSYEDERLKIRLLNAGSQTIELIQYLQTDYQERTAGTVDHIAFEVNDIDAAVKRLKALEVRLLFDEPRTVMDCKIIFFVGPDGERLELVQKG